LRRVKRIGWREEGRVHHRGGGDRWSVLIDVVTLRVTNGVWTSEWFWRRVGRLG
jgi:hypothetical protein